RWGGGGGGVIMVGRGAAGARCGGSLDALPAMDTFAFAAVLFAAACHAGWNATIKRGLDPLATTVLISVGAALVSAALLPVVGWPAVAAWPWRAASVAIHLVYFAALIEMYPVAAQRAVLSIRGGSSP